MTSKLETAGQRIVSIAKQAKDTAVVQAYAKIIIEKLETAA